MDFYNKNTKDIGAYGEATAVVYLQKRGFQLKERNFVRKMGEIDIVVEQGGVLHFVEVKTNAVDEFPEDESEGDRYDPSLNLHETKIRKVARMGEWYVAEKEWEGDWQVDGCLVWIRRRDGMAKVRYLPQIV